MAEIKINEKLLSLLNVKNILDNGGFDIWQRGTNFVSPAHTTYQADRWRYYSLGPTVTITKETTTVHSNGEASMKIAETSTGSDWSLQHIIENYKDYRGKTLTYSMWVHSSNSGVRLYLSVSSGQISYSSYHSGTPGWEKLTVTRLISTNNTWLTFGLESTSAVNGSIIYIDDAMAVIGSENINYIPLSPAEEWERCQRYYETGNVRIYGQSTTDPDPAHHSMGQHIHFNVAKVSTPTITGNNHYTKAHGTSTWVAGANDFQSQDTNSFGWNYFLMKDPTDIGGAYSDWTAEVT